MKFLTKEIIDGIEKWFKWAAYGLALMWLLDLLLVLPDQMAKPIADMLTSHLPK